jgi:hypothetical protein
MPYGHQTQLRLVDSIGKFNITYLNHKFFFKISAESDLSLYSLPASQLTSFFNYEL